ncbi:diaminopimelate decarboxylase [Methanophagales archaeon]|nr:diaminopimelate decarboxylase [Methanophagales archaeon]
MLKESGHLVFGGVDVVELAETYGTPLYVTDEDMVRDNFRRYNSAFETADKYYAVKANGNLAILKILASEGAGADVFSSGELQLVMSAGIPRDKILFNGNSKSEEDLRAVVDAGVKVSVDSQDEMRTLSAIAVAMGKEVEIAIRVNPDISPKVNPKIATGLRESKFGIPFYEVIATCEDVKRLPNITLTGLHCHIGSQILDVSVYREATEKMMNLVAELYARGMELEFVDLGGGLGISHRKEEKAPTQTDLADAILPTFDTRLNTLGIKLKLVLEPGRSIVGPATILLSRVNTVKHAYKNFVAIDAGFNLFMRPVMYDAYHEVVVANKVNEQATVLCTVVGPICESGDILAHDRLLPEVERGDLIAILNAGAYGFSMSSQYNGRPRCAEVLICDGKVDVIRAKESADDLIRHQVIPPRLM